MCTAEDLRNSNADFDYDESIDAAIAKRKYLLDRLVTEEDLSDSEDDLSDSEDELSAMGEDRDSDTDWLYIKTVAACVVLRQKMCIVDDAKKCKYLMWWKMYTMLKKNE